MAPLGYYSGREFHHAGIVETDAGHGFEPPFQDGILIFHLGGGSFVECSPRSRQLKSCKPTRRSLYRPGFQFWLG